VTYLFPCGCGREHPVVEAQAGQRVVCSCGAELEVPTLLGLRRLRQAEAPTEPSGGQRNWGTRQRLLVVGGVTVLVGLALAGWFAARCPRMVEVQAFPPLATLELWESLQMGVGKPPNPWEKAFLDIIHSHQRMAALGLAIAGLGALITASSFVVGRRGVSRPRPRGG